MRQAELCSLLQELRGGRRFFHYFKDRYALTLLALACGDGTRVRDLKRSPWARLLDRPVVRDVLSRASDGIVTPGDLLAAWPARPLPYVITFGEWGSWRSWCRDYHQTSRRGANLVVRLNFPRVHDRRFAELLFAADWFRARYAFSHPVDRSGRLTLAWARIDVDMPTRTAVIEEIQSDWIRDARKAYHALRDGRPVFGNWSGCERVVSARRMSVYYERVLAPHRAIWAEAMLAATLEVLVARLGIRRVYYHTVESGLVFKRIERSSAPPRSLYSSLPRRFGFGGTREPPQFVTDAADGYIAHQVRHRAPEWFVHEWDEPQVATAAPWLSASAGV